MAWKPIVLGCFAISFVLAPVLATPLTSTRRILPPNQVRTYYHPNNQLYYTAVNAGIGNNTHLAVVDIGSPYLMFLTKKTDCPQCHYPPFFNTAEYVFNAPIGYKEINKPLPINTGSGQAKAIMAQGQVSVAGYPPIDTTSLLFLQGRIPSIFGMAFPHPIENRKKSWPYPNNFFDALREKYPVENTLSFLFCKNSPKSHYTMGGIDPNIPKDKIRYTKQVASGVHYQTLTESIHLGSENLGHINYGYLTQYDTGFNQMSLEYFLYQKFIRAFRLAAIKARIRMPDLMHVPEGKARIIQLTPTQVEHLPSLNFTFKDMYNGKLFIVSIPAKHYLKKLPNMVNAYILIVKELTNPIFDKLNLHTMSKPKIVLGLPLFESQYVVIKRGTFTENYRGAGIGFYPNEGLC
ncbi:MAG: hypothetical protein A3F17_02815 [Gammaproteobacteria bacterium RIFCSPHIGHO2_12_FULL_41_15]|nr:MAG: hypothetical protein A3F17_02815 [Gammaproteobacteria bacterium RIFCSPHIGHO2_12_FULL_41_15]